MPLRPQRHPPTGSEAPSKPSAALLTGQESPATRPTSLLTGQEPCAERSADEQTGHNTTKPITADIEQLINDITTAFGHLFSGAALSGNDIQCIVLCAMLVILIVLIVYLSILGRWGMYIGWFFEDVWHWLKRHFTTHPQSFGEEIVGQEENP